MKHNFSLLAIDMGAGSIRIMQLLIGDEVSFKECHRFENPMIMENGALRWDLKVICGELERGLQLVLNESRMPVVSIGVDSWGVDFVLLNHEGQPLENPVSYRDERTNGMKELWEQSMNGEETFRRTGINFNIFNTLYQILSLSDQAKLSNTTRILFMADYLNYYLSGVAVNELTLASTSQMLSCVYDFWDAHILESLGIREEVLSPLVFAGSILGPLQMKIQTDSLPKLIAVAGHDTACAVAAIPFETDDAAFLATGTWCIMGMLSDYPLMSDEAFLSGISNERSADGRFRPLKNLMGLWLIQQLRKAFGNRHSYEAIDQMAAANPVSTVLIDPSEALFYNPENMLQAFDAFLIKAGHQAFQSEAAYYRCAYDSLVASFRKSMLLFEKLRGKPFKVIHVIGGGVQSALLCQLIANGLEREVIAGPVEAAVYGNMLIQLKTLGKLDTTLKEKLYASMTLQKYAPAGA